MSITIEQRRANRLLLHAVEGGFELLDQERERDRERETDEDSEPAHLDGYI